jgi:hypothetical protein
MEFINPEGESIGRPTFSSSYYCWNFLPKQIIVKGLDMKKKDENNKNNLESFMKKD